MFVLASTGNLTRPGFPGLELGLAPMVKGIIPFPRTYPITEDQRRDKTYISADNKGIINSNYSFFSKQSIIKVLYTWELC
jgi:hypothetical protein